MADFLSKHDFIFSAEQYGKVKEIFCMLQSDLEIADEANIPIVTALANQRLNAYLRSIYKI